MINLRPYQSNLIEGVRSMWKQGQKKVILCSATGSGKTVIFRYMALTAANKGIKVLILANRRKLVDQVKLDHENITVITVQSKKFNTKDYGLIIVDEAHYSDFDKVVQDAECFVVGCTATPHRSAKQTSLEDIYSGIVNGIQVQELINLGFLARPYSYGVKIDLSKILSKGGDYDGDSLAKYYKDHNIYSNVLDQYRKLANNEKAIVFAPSTESGKEITKMFSENGYQAFYVDSYMKNAREITETYESTENGILVNYQLYTTGYDHPEIKCVILLRATKSIITLMQMVGRGGRTTETKKTFKILDFGNNFLRHGLWQDDRTWTLEKKKGRDKLGLAPVKLCPKCGFMNSPIAKVCEICLTKLPESKKKKKTYSELMQDLELIENVLSKEIVDVLKKAKNKGYKAGWVMYQLTDKQKDEFNKYMGYHANYKKRF